jgi:hypothetical protein
MDISLTSIDRSKDKVKRGFTKMSPI